MYKILSIIAVLLLVSCNAEKQAQKKEQRAIALVKNSNRAIDAVWGAVREKHPCLNDTSDPIITPDTASFIIPSGDGYLVDKAGTIWGVSIDTGYLTGEAPTLPYKENSSQTLQYADVKRKLLSELNEEFFLLKWGTVKLMPNGAKVQAIKGQGLKVDVPTYDTTRFIKDKEELSFLMKQRDDLLNLYTYSSGQADSLAKVVQTGEASIHKLKFRLYGLISLIVLVVGGLIYLRIKGSTVSGIVNSIFKKS